MWEFVIFINAFSSVANLIRFKNTGDKISLAFGLACGLVVVYTLGVVL